MVRLSSLVIALAGATVAAGCATPVNYFDRGTHESGWQDTGTPSRPVTVDRLARYYVDVNGDMWDDRGKKVEGAP